MHPRSREPPKKKKETQRGILPWRKNIFHSVRFEHAGYSRFIVSHREGLCTPPREKETRGRDYERRIGQKGLKEKGKKTGRRNKTPINRLYRRAQYNERRYKKNWAGVWTVFSFFFSFLKWRLPCETAILRSCFHRKRTLTASRAQKIEKTNKHRANCVREIMDKTPVSFLQLIIREYTKIMPNISSDYCIRAKRGWSPQSTWAHSIRENCYRDFRRK